LGYPLTANAGNDAEGGQYAHPLFEPGTQQQTECRKQQAPSYPL